MSQVLKSLAQKWSAASNEVNSEKIDLLLQYFESRPIFAWIVLQYLNDNSQPAVQEYLCSRLHKLGEKAIEQYLLQFVYLALNKPVLENTVIQLCSESFPIAIKAQWLLTALCQEQPKNKTLESFRERTYKAAEEWKGDGHVRTLKMGPLSPLSSHLVSPPFSPGTSMMISQLDTNPIYHNGEPLALVPPDHVVMSPPAGELAATCVSPMPGAAASVGDNVQNGFALAMSIPWLTSAEQCAVGAGVGVPAGAISEAGCAATGLPDSHPEAVGRGNAASGDSDRRPRGTTLSPPRGQPFLCTAPRIVTSSKRLWSGELGADAAVQSQSCGGLRMDGGAFFGTGSGSRGVPVLGTGRGPLSDSEAESYSEAESGAAIKVDPSGRMEALRAELGHGEQVTALLARSHQQGGTAVLAVAEEDLDDGRPMSPQTRLRYETFNATLDFVEALCDVSYRLTNYSQGERQRTLRQALEHINSEIEKINRQNFAMWFPMGRACDRVLRLTAKEAVLLNSREKAPFLLYIEVLEEQPEGGNPERVAGRLGAAAVAGGDAGGGASRAGTAGLSAPAVEFGRRETYGIALTEMGAQHQQHYMRLSPGRPVASSSAPGGASPLRDGTSPLQAAVASPGLDTADALQHLTLLPELPQHPSPDPRASYPSALASPAPMYARSPSLAAQLEEHAESRSAAAAAAAAAEMTAANASGVSASPQSAVVTGSGAGAGAAAQEAVQGLDGWTDGKGSTSVSLSQLPAVASHLTIPTRSSSSNNVGTLAALAVAMAATTSNPGQDLTVPHRSSEGGSVGAQAGIQPVTPRRAGSYLPPRPPAAPLPAGTFSPVHAAKEVSPQGVHASGGGLSPTRLLHRSLGPEEGAALAAAVLSDIEVGRVPSVSAACQGAAPAAGAATTASAASVCSGGDNGSQGTGPAVPQAIETPAEPAPRPPWHSYSGDGSSAVVPGSGAAALAGVGAAGMAATAAAAGGLGMLWGAAQYAHTLPRLQGSELSDVESKLQAVGLLSPPSRVTPDPVVESKLDNVRAALQGDGPMVRVRILPLHQTRPQQQPAAGAAAGSAASSAGSANKPPPVPVMAGASRSGAAVDGASSGASGEASASVRGGSSFALLNRNSKAAATGGAAASAAAPPGLLDSGGSGSISGSVGEKSKGLGLKFRFGGLCGKPTTGDDSDDSGGQHAATAAALSAPLPPGGACGSLGPIALAANAGPAGATDSGRQLRPAGWVPVHPRLVRVVFEVTQGISLAIPSPHGKGRGHARTPSHVAMEQLADKFKVDQLPPPYECGPPLGPVSYRADGSNHSVQERYSEEGEGEGAAAAGLVATSASDRPVLAEPSSSASGKDLTGGADTAAPREGGTVARVALASAAPSRSTGGSASCTSGLEGTGTASSSDERAASSKSKTRLSASDGGAGVFAAHLHSLRGKLSRAGSQHPQAEGGGASSVGPSPRGGSPTRSSASQAPIPASALQAAGGSNSKWSWRGVSGGSGSSGGAASGSAGAPALQDSVPSGGSAAAPPQTGSGRLAAGNSGPVGGAASAPLTASSSSPTASAGAPAAALGGAGSGSIKVTDGRQEREALEERRRREARAVYGELWADKMKRVQRESPHGSRKGWGLRCVIVKSGDDCRQELLALQLVRTFGEIFREANLPLWVRPYEVLVTSNKTALIEMVPDTLSIHTIKSRSPPGTSLSDHFFAKFGRPGSPGCIDTQRRFTESLAAYSLICYILQIKDRHNGNILMADDGRIVHIDFGFLLSNSPGGVNFESAPFKLTRELLEVMESNSDGKPSEMFDYFKVLMIQGFLALRKSSDRILLLLRLMARSGFPCFKAGDRAIKNVEKRLQLSLTEVQCVPHVLHLIAESLDAWRTRQYDYYQRLLNGIL